MTLKTQIATFLKQAGLDPEQITKLLELQAAERTKAKEWLDPSELKSEYGISQSTAAKYRMKRKIPFSKIGSRYIRYSREEINKWLRDNAVEVA